MCAVARRVAAHSEARGGDARSSAITRGELGRAVEAQQSSSSSGICSFVRGGTGRALPEPYKRNFSGLFLCMSETDSMMVA